MTKANLRQWWNEQIQKFPIIPGLRYEINSGYLDYINSIQSARDYKDEICIISRCKAFYAKTLSFTITANQPTKETNQFTILKRTHNTTAETSSTIRKIVNMPKEIQTLTSKILNNVERINAHEGSFFRIKNSNVYIHMYLPKINDNTNEEWFKCIKFMIDETTEVDYFTTRSLKYACEPSQFEEGLIKVCQESEIAWSVR